MYAVNSIELMLFVSELSLRTKGFEYLENGWSWLGGQKDITDNEWRLNIKVVLSITPWVCAHLFGSELLRIFNQRNLVRHSLAL